MFKKDILVYSLNIPVQSSNFLMKYQYFYTPSTPNILDLVSVYLLYEGPIFDYNSPYFKITLVKDYNRHWNLE